MRLLPRSLFGRLMLALASGLIIAQLLSAAINFAERDQLLIRASGRQPAQRIADIVKLLDTLAPEDRLRIVSILNVPPLVLSLQSAASDDGALAAGDPHAPIFTAALQSALGDDRPIRFQARAPGAMRTGGPPQAHAEMMGATAMHSEIRRFVHHGMSFNVQVRLRDGTWASFDSEVPQDADNLSWRLFLTLVVLLVTMLVLSFVAVRWITRPLHVLTAAADELGRDINRPPLRQSGRQRHALRREGRNHRRREPNRIDRAHTRRRTRHPRD